VLRARRFIQKYSLSALAVAALTVVSMSWYLRYTNADAVMGSLISTQRMTLFFWGQDRLASVLPALAFPIRDPLFNFSAQMAMQGLAFFTLVGLFVRFHLRETGRNHAGTAAAATLVAGLLTTLILTTEANYWFMFEQVYALAMLLCLLGLDSSMSDHRGRQVAAVGLIIVSIMMIPSMALLAPAAWLLGQPETRRRRFCITIGVIALAFAINKIATIVSPNASGQSDLYTDFSVTRLRRGVGVVYDNVRGIVDDKVFILVVMQAAVVLVVRRSALSRDLQRAFVFAPLFAVGWLVLFTANGWVEANGFHPRYHFPVFAVVILFVAGGVAELMSLIAEYRFSSASAKTRRQSVVGVAAACIAILSLGTARLLTDDGVPVLAYGFEEVNATRHLDVDFVTGSYWQVWPIIAVARSEDLDMYGIALRSETIRVQILDDRPPIPRSHRAVRRRRRPTVRIGVLHIRRSAVARGGGSQRDPPGHQPYSRCRPTHRYVTLSAQNGRHSNRVSLGCSLASLRC